MMRHLWEVDELTEDDYQGVWVLWDYIVNGVTRCGPDYTMDRQDSSEFLCIPGSDGPDDPDIAPEISTNKSEYSPGENIVVEYSNFDRTQGSWYGIYRVGAPHSAWDNVQQVPTWGWVSNSSGTITVARPELAPGVEYEVRLFRGDTYDVVATSATFGVQ